MTLLAAGDAGRTRVSEPPAPSDAAVRLDDVSVRYRLTAGRPHSLKEYVVGRWRRATQGTEFEALRAVSLSIGRGEAVAIVGRNGSGKTTLLRLIARVLAPSAGRVQTWGRVAPILDVVGALHPELTGRENVFLNGTMLGLSRRQIVERFDRIVDFAEIGPFIDQPLRVYSAGMMARLGFAIASDTDADIFVIDEALAVGDERFQRKCAARIDAIRRGGTTFILVSHDMQSVARLCRRAVWLDRGVLRADGRPDRVVPCFLEAE